MFLLKDLNDWLLSGDVLGLELWGIFLELSFCWEFDASWWVRSGDFSVLFVVEILAESLSLLSDAPDLNLRGQSPDFMSRRLVSLGSCFVKACMGGPAMSPDKFLQELCSNGARFDLD